MNHIVDAVSRKTGRAAGRELGQRYTRPGLKASNAMPGG